MPEIKDIEFARYKHLPDEEQPALPGYATHVEFTMDGRRLIAVGHDCPPAVEHGIVVVRDADTFEPVKEVMSWHYVEYRDTHFFGLYAPEVAEKLIEVGKGVVIDERYRGLAELINQSPREA